MKKFFEIISTTLLWTAIGMISCHLLGKYFFPALPRIDGYIIFAVAGAGLILKSFIFYNQNKRFFDVDSMTLAQAMRLAEARHRNKILGGDRFYR